MSVRIGAISVGGMGVRFRRPGTQKCLTLLSGRPILEYCIDSFVANKVKLIFLLTGHLHEQISSYLVKRSLQGKDSDVVVSAVYGGLEGEIGALRKLRPFIDEDFLYTEGDTVFTNRTVQSLISKADRHKDGVAVLSVSKSVQIALKHPRISVDSLTSRIASIAVTDQEMENNRSAKYARMGLYYFRKKVFPLLENIPFGRPPSEIIRYALMNDLPFFASITTNPWFCLHDQEDFKKWNRSDVKQYFMD